MRLFVIAVCLGLGWGAATGELGLANLLLGFALAAVVLSLVREGEGVLGYLTRAGELLGLVGLLAANLGAAALVGAAYSLRPRMNVRPRLISYPLKARGEPEVHILALLVTLSPEVLAVGLSADRRTLLVHAFNSVDAERLRSRIADRLERRVLEVFG